MIAICVGHSRMGDMGALSIGGVSEWHYNCDIAKRVMRKLQNLGHDACVISKYPKPTYGAAMDWLAGELRKRQATCAVELHFNSSDDPTSHGHEWLHWHSSASGRRLAQALQVQMRAHFPDLKNRGLVPVESVSKRGGGFLLKTPCPAAIAEPFFGSNLNEWAIFRDERELYAEVLALALDDWKGGQA